MTGMQLPMAGQLVITFLLSLVALLVFITTRHIQLVGRRHRRPGSQHGAPSSAKLEDYCLIVLGSGGHTKEMLMMMDDGFCSFDRFHRRYLLTGGDAMSENHLEDYEEQLKLLCGSKGGSSGTYDKRVVTRARRVHQPLWTTPWSALRSIFDIFPALLSPPPQEARGGRRYPRRIFSNGPATGFFVGLVAHLLKMFYLVPDDVMGFVYIESWARISTLSLTGKLLYYTGIADVFLVQHEAVGSKYGLQNAGEMVFNSRREVEHS